MSKMDVIDHQLLASLRFNARLPVVKLARKLGMSRATVQNRMNRLRRQGIIRGYTIDIDSGINSDQVKALMSIAVEGKKALSVTNSLRGYPAIVALHNTNGRWDLIAEIHTDTLESFNRLLNDVRLIDGVSSTETSLLLDTLYG